MDKQTSLAILSRVQREKQAATAAEVFNDQASAPLRQEALQKILRAAMFGSGAGLAAGGGVGLYNLLRRAKGPGKRTTRLAEVPVPVPADQTLAQPDDEPDLIPFGKAAGWAQDLFSGRNATEVGGVPWFYPAATAAMIGGGAGGYALVNKIMQARKKKEQDLNVARAQQEFEQAMLGMRGGQKQAADSPVAKLAATLDDLYDALEKRAGVLDALGLDDNLKGKLLGAYGTYAVPAALMTGYAAYKATERRSQKKMLEKALKLRQRRRQALEPAELVARPVPVPAGG